MHNHPRPIPAIPLPQSPSMTKTSSHKKHWQCSAATQSRCHVMGQYQIVKIHMRQPVVAISSHIIGTCICHDVAVRLIQMVRHPIVEPMRLSCWDIHQSIFQKSYGIYSTQPVQYLVQSNQCRTRALFLFHMNSQRWDDNVQIQQSNSHVLICQVNPGFRIHFRNGKYWQPKISFHHVLQQKLQQAFISNASQCHRIKGRIAWSLRRKVCWRLPAPCHRSW